jgi:hypothetical protein
VDQARVSEWVDASGNFLRLTNKELKAIKTERHEDKYISSSYLSIYDARFITGAG